MGKPQVPIEVDEASGVWSVDGMPMILVPRHFLVNNHAAIESALGEARYAEQLFAAGHKSAYVWCEKEAHTHGLKGVDVFHHYMKRLSQRGWGQFRVDSVDAQSGRARVRVDHSVFVLEHKGPPRKVCYMFRGWFPGALEFVVASAGRRLNAQVRSCKIAATEVHCGAEGVHDHCIFEMEPQ
jgi:hypothetical protein